MGKGINKAIIVGNLTRDPETRHMANGNPVTNITIATNDAWKDKETGEQREKAEYHRVTFFDSLAETVSQHASKGTQMYIEGPLRTNEWEKDGQKHYSTSIHAKEFQFLGSKQDGNQSQGNQGGYNERPDDYEKEGDIPF